jgi:hypothetical protein
LNFSDIKNNVTSDVYLAIDKDSKWTLIPIPSDQDWSIPITDADSFTKLPPIKFLIKEDGPGKGGRLYIQSQYKEDSIAFSVKLSIVADIDLDKSIDL